MAAMEIVRESLVEGARRARGTVVVIDVYRAFTTAAVALARGAARVVVVADPTAALALRDRGGGDRCVGEVGGRPPPGFDHGNSPFELSRADVAGRTIILSTRAGAVGLEAAAHADRLFAASFVVAAATARALRALDPPRVTLVAMGLAGRVRTEEDEACADYLAALLRGDTPDRDAVRARVLAGPESRKFEDPTRPWFHPEDRRMALAFDAYGFALPVAREAAGLVLRAAPAR